MTTKVVLFRKNGYIYVAYIDSMNVGCFDDYEFAANNLKTNGLRKLVVNGNVEFWGKDN